MYPFFHMKSQHQLNLVEHIKLNTFVSSRTYHSHHPRIVALQLYLPTPGPQISAHHIVLAHCSRRARDLSRYTAKMANEQEGILLTAIHSLHFLTFPVQFRSNQNKSKRLKSFSWQSKHNI